ncbi:hypothetical protein NliqN6_6841 [Naganishia liquefaciens]|uniref:Squalene cyclase C-terminal domain-containing protein n=1 Tax=Naganishia liquefaciens TaxID=104408 RepID=A0A8H3U278_9TREE|nr:hypothetical protein NliqN6_6841 [Naganishia liquefaciens]
MFALEALSLVGETYGNSKSVHKSCVTEKYCQHPMSQVVQTSWVTMGLMYGQYIHKEVIRRACDLIMSRQNPDGSWLQEDAEGIFNETCVIDHPNDKFSFTIWALGMADGYLKS